MLLTVTEQGRYGPRMPPVKKAKAATLLIVDDDAEIVGILRSTLSRVGYQIVEALNGADALARAREAKPDVVLLDVMMPGKSGWEVAKDIRDDATLKSTGIIMLTAIGPKMNELTSPLYGVDDYLDKPFDFHELEARIAKVITKRGGTPPTRPVKKPAKKK